MKPHNRSATYKNHSMVRRHKSYKTQSSARNRHGRSQYPYGFRLPQWSTAHRNRNYARPPQNQRPQGNSCPPGGDTYLPRSQGRSANAFLSFPPPRVLLPVGKQRRSGIELPSIVRVLRQLASISSSLEHLLGSDWIQFAALSKDCT